MAMGRKRISACSRASATSATLLTLAALAQGCGVGFGASVHSVSLGEMKGSFNDVPAGKIRSSASFRAPVLQVYDKTGIMLAALGNAGAAYNARRDAEQAAWRRGARAGDSYSYSYRVTPPTPGLWTSLSYSWGSTDKLTLQRVDAKGEPVGAEVVNSKDKNKGMVAEFFEFDMQATLGRPRLTRALRGTVQLGAYWREYTLLGSNLGTGAIAYEVDDSWIGMPLSFRVDHEQLGMVRPWVRIQIDPLLSLLTKAVGDDDQSWLYYRIQAGADVPIGKFLAIGAWVGHERMPLGFGDHDTSIYQAQATVVLLFGGKD